MIELTKQKESTPQSQKEREELAEKLKKEAILQNLGRLLYIYMLLYTPKKVLK